jgi:hypothetical protein
MHRLSIRLSLVVLFISSFAAMAGYDVGDGMLLLEDQRAALTELAKRVPTTVTADEFSRAGARCRGAALVLDKLIKEAGSVVDVTDPATGTVTPVFTAGPLTPPSILAAAEVDRASLFTSYTGLLQDAVNAFGAIETELALQAGVTAAPGPDFLDLNKLLVVLRDVIRKGHRLHR